MERGRRWGAGRWAVLALVLGLAGGAGAGADAPQPGIGLDELFPGAEFDPAVPTQEKLLGVAPGARPLRHAEVLRYFEALAASPRAARIPYARSHEGRELYVLAVADEATIARLPEFREEHARRMDPRGRSPERDGDVLGGARAVAWMAYGIHGDELSSVDAAAALAYWLVAGEDQRARALRSELLVLIDPCENPDGRERFLAQTTAFAHATPNPDTEDLSHTTVWPWGRGNHYLFDLNRDWFTLVHPESARSSRIAAWTPQLMVDSHEMGPDQTYLFPPARHPFNPHQAEHVVEWWERFAADQARALDARGYGYYTREWNEEFFPGYGSSWSTYLGSIGILYEMSSTEGTLVRKRGGVTRTYPQAVEHQVASSVANLTTLGEHRGEILRDHVAARRAAVARGASGPVRAWVFPGGSHPRRTEALADLLRRQGIEVLRLTAAGVRAELHDARTGRAETRELPAGTFVVRLDQPAGNLARVLLDPHVPMEAAFLREQREYLERGKGSRIYDTTAWSLPLAFGVEAYWAARPPEGRFVAFGSIDEPGPRVAAPMSLAFPSMAEPVFAWVLEGSSDASVYALADLLQRGLSVRVAEKPFGVAGLSFTRGAFVIEREANPADVAEVVARVASRHMVPISPVTTALAESGPDLGGNHFHKLVAPRVGIWTGMPVSPSSYGALWHLLDRRLGMRFSGLDLARFSSTDLGRYNVLVFPPAFGGGKVYRHLLGEPGVQRLKAWIEAGGTAIGIGGGAEFLAGKELALTRTRLRREALDRYPPVVWSLDPEAAADAGPFRAVGLRAPTEDDDGGQGKGEPGAMSAKPRSRTGKKKPAEEPRQRLSPYDVAPVIGPGARPFLGDRAPGTPVGGEPADLRRWMRPLLPPGRDKPAPEDLERADERLRRFAPKGAFLRVDLDPEHWLTWGIGSEVDALVRARDALVAEPPVQVPARLADLDALHLGGLLWPEAAARIARTAYTTREAVGRGQVILFLDEPNFRGWTRGTRRLLLNAILYGPGLGTHWSTPW